MENRTPSCCKTSNVINFFSRCFCISPPRYEALSTKEREKLEQQAEHDIIAQKLFYTEKPAGRGKKVI